ncbi:MAG: acyltransferase family protein [Halioglobus sp.]|nr:acyltransferase family protein [Halioglobus sp.]
MTAAQRLHGLDFLRASMMLLGIVLHGAQMYMTMHLGFDYYKDPQLSPVMDGILIVINTFRMPVFFFISGFFSAMLYERYSLPGLLRNRYRRIVLPFIVMLPPLALLLSLQWISSSQLMATGSIGLDTRYVSRPDLLYNNTHHLWFLYYLVYILVAWAALLWLWERVPGALRNALTGWYAQFAVRTSLVLVLLGVLSAWLAVDTYAGRLNGGILFQPYWPAVSFFGLCFVAGWGLWHRREALPRLELRCWRNLLAATVFLAVGLVAFFAQGQYESETWFPWHPLLAVANGLSVAFFVAGFTGLFSRYFSGYNPWVRYLSDSAYWVYILHQSALLFFAVPLYHWGAPAELKFLLVCIGATALCLASYDLLVRNSWLGAFLGGRRYPRGLPRRASS